MADMLWFICSRDAIGCKGKKMTEQEWHKRYDDHKKEIEAMPKEQRMERLEEIRIELAVMANSFAGDETGNVATYLHESVNNIGTAQKIFSGEAKDDRNVRG
jgi:predicted transcriptional regulator